MKNEIWEENVISAISFYFNESIKFYFNFIYFNESILVKKFNGANMRNGNY